MDYSLAKQLKDAGYVGKGRTFILPDGRTYDWMELKTGGIRFPTLEELVEACGDDFSGLRLDQKMKNPNNEQWAADRTQKRPVFETYIGSTPTEAVANLWLALHGK